jgi:tetratricopeptide (TPR) repeat protein
MKKLLFVIFISFLPSIGYSQDYGNNSDALKLCSVLQSNSFASNSAADDALKRILGTIGASKRFVLQPCSNIANAKATSYKGIRYILYDPDFMNTLNYGNDWGNLFILAHEVGHHINGHTLDWVLYAAEVVEPKTLGQIRQQELEADEFAGFVLAKLGGPISAANQVISKISNNSDDSYNTHPSRNKRLNAVAIGYNNANKTALPATLVLYDGEPLSPKAISYYESAKSYASKNENYQAISNYLLAANGGFRFGFFKSATIKEQLGDTKGAVTDYSLYIDNGGVYPWGFINRGLLFMKDENWENALNDFNNALELDPLGETCFHNYNAIAHCKAVLGDMDGACEMWNRALEFESLKNSATMNIIDYCP